MSFKPLLESFSAASKSDVSWPFLKQLRDLGRAETKAWLAANFDKIGVESTLDMDRALRASAELGEYFTRLIAERRASPQDDMISLLVEAEADGVLLAIEVREGEVPVGRTIAVIGAPGEERNLAVFEFVAEE